MIYCKDFKEIQEIYYTTDNTVPHYLKTIAYHDELMSDRNEIVEAMIAEVYFKDFNVKNNLSII